MTTMVHLMEISKTYPDAKATIFCCRSCSREAVMQLIDNKLVVIFLSMGNTEPDIVHTVIGLSPDCCIIREPDYHEKTHKPIKIGQFVLSGEDVVLGTLDAVLGLGIEYYSALTKRDCENGGHQDENRKN